MEAPPKALDKHGDGKSFKNILKSFSALADFPCLALHPFQIKTEDLQEGTTQQPLLRAEPEAKAEPGLSPASRDKAMMAPTWQQDARGHLS